MESQVFYSLDQSFQVEVDDALDGIEIQLVEGDDVIEAVQELWSKLLAQTLLDDAAGILLVFSSIANPPFIPAEVKPTPLPKSFSWRVPALEVMMMMVLRKSMSRPLPSVSLPSSSTCKSRLNILLLAFSISSSNTMLYGLRRTFRSAVHLRYSLRILEAHLPDVRC